MVPTDIKLTMEKEQPDSESCTLSELHSRFRHTIRTQSFISAYSLLENVIAISLISLRNLKTNYIISPKVAVYLQFRFLI